MDLVQVTEMKNRIAEELRRIEGLKRSMEDTLAGLVQWEKHLQDGNALFPEARSKRGARAKKIQPKVQVTARTAHTGPSERVSRALSGMRGEFTRSQLLAEAEGDGKGEISSRTYSNIFSRLLHKQRVQCTKGNPGQRDSLYIKSGEKKPDQEFLS